MTEKLPLNWGESSLERLESAEGLEYVQPPGWNPYPANHDVILSLIKDLRILRAQVPKEVLR